MAHEPTPADRIGAGFNLCHEHDKLVTAAVAVLAAHEDKAPAAEIQQLRAARDAQEEQLRRFIDNTRNAFTPRRPGNATVETTYTANANANQF